MGKDWDKLGTGKLISDKDDWDWQTHRGGRGTDPLANKPRFGPVMTNEVARNKMQQWHYEWAKEVFRVLKPGAHILAFSGTRTYHRLACAIEDAGFEIRNMLSWVTGSGFPKGLSISKAIDKKAGFEQPIIGRQELARPISQGDFDRAGSKRSFIGSDEKDGSMSNPELRGAVTQPISEEAQLWQGWNTQLKPAHEPIVFAQKPISEKSIVENVLIHGTGAINIDACRSAVNPDVDAIGKTTKRGTREAEAWREGSGFKNPVNPMAGVLPSGRYPANLILSHHPDCKLIQRGRTEVRHTKREATETTGKGVYSDGWIRNPDEYSFDAGKPEVWQCVEGCPVRILNEQSGNTKGGTSVHISTKTFGLLDDDSWTSKPTLAWQFPDSGGAARFFFTTQMDFEREIVPFFYCPKPSVAERNAGLKGKRNTHITVKPLGIMRWLVRLSTRRGGIVLDPFLGSGTTAIAAENEGCDWLACDNDESYCRIAEARIKALGGTQTRLIDFS